MTPIIQFKAKTNILLVKVPEDAHSYEIYDNNIIGGKCIMYLRGVPDYACDYTENIPPGSWHIEGNTNEVTEEQMKKVCEYEKTFGWSSYGQEPNGSYQWYATVKQSFSSLLTHLGATDGNYLLLTEK